MTALRRAFVAVVPPAVVLDAIEQATAPVRANHSALRWTGRDQWHLTLRFLGGVADADALAAVVGGTLRDASPITLRLGGPGAFPNPARATIVWLGVRSGLDDVTGLAGEISRVTAELAPADTRPYRPHLTLARLNRPGDVAPLLGSLGDDAVGPWWVADDVVVMESDTRPEGAVYREVVRLPLGDPGS